jgi:hypothetical protein
LQAITGAGGSIELAEKLVKLLGRNCLPALLHQQLTGGRAGRLQNEIGSGEAGGSDGAIDQRLIIGRDAQVPAEARGGSHG